MKELSIEEKAKAYDEALKKAKDMLSYKEVRREDMEYLFPELVESEDERIRKELLNYLYDVHDDDEERARWIAWLEKQSTPQVRTGLEWVNTIDDACDKRYLEEYAHGEYCHEQSFKWGFQEGVDWLEKQGEQKPYGQREECLDCQMNYAGECKGSCAMKRDEQKPVETEKGTNGNEREIPNSAWSEEDERKLQLLIAMCDETKGDSVTYSVMYREMEELKIWLRTFKERYTWKPTLQQINVLSIVVKHG